MKPFVEPIADSLVDYGQEIELDSCEQTLISLITVKRFTELRFPESPDQLDYLDIEYSIDTTQFTASEKNEYEESVESGTNEWVLLWINNCKRNFDTVAMHPYSIDSLKLIWTRISNLEKSSKKIVKESWMLKVKSDSIIEPYFLNLKIEVIDSTGRVISKMTGMEKRDK